VERGAGKQREWAFRQPGQQYNQDKVTTRKTGKDISIMIWAAIWIGGRSDIVIMEGDEESARGGVTARVYCQLLEDQIPKIYRRGQIFQHDNAFIHTANIIKDWLRNHKINVMD